MLSILVLSPLIIFSSVADVNIQLTAQLFNWSVILLDIIPVFSALDSGVCGHSEVGCWVIASFTITQISLISSADKSSNDITFQSASLISHVLRLTLFHVDNHLNSHLGFLFTSTSHSHASLWAYIVCWAENISKDWNKSLAHSVKLDNTFHHRESYLAFISSDDNLLSSGILLLSYHVLRLSSHLSASA